MEQATDTFVTSAAAIVPLPLLTVQVWPAGCVRTVTAYAAPLASAVENTSAPLAVNVRSSAPLFCRTSVPLSPATIPPAV
ncbi:MAG TPA: hypothetical protein VF319_04730 [Caldimonas sp.]